MYVVSLIVITCDVCSVLKLYSIEYINAVLYSPGVCEVTSVLGGVAVGVVADLLSVYTSTTHIILISAEM